VVCSCRRRFRQRAVTSAYNEALKVLRSLGAVIVDPVKIPTFDRAALTAVERVVFLYEFKAGINACLAGLAPGMPVQTLEEIIAFNKRNPTANLPFFGQELLESAQAKGPRQSRNTSRQKKSVNA
jgi:amidase